MSGKAKGRILVVDDEAIKRSILEDGLAAAGYAVDTASNPLEAEGLLAKTFHDVVLSDLQMPGQDGLSFLRELKEKHPTRAVILMTAYATVDTAVEAMKLGAFDYIQKPFTTEELLLKLDRLFEHERLASENAALRRQLSRPRAESRIVGQSEAVREVLARIHAVASTDATVLIEGESGTGKELAAHTIHETSHRASGPFIAVSCAALPRELVETELFGHESGAFTGASRRRIGRFELAHGGTLFLDDVDDIPVGLQVKLLRVLQERTFERVGGEQAVHSNVRLIAATKKSLATAVAAGEFREDLYYRLSVVPLHMPALRDRLSDLPALTEYFLERLSVKMNRGTLGITPAALRKLEQHVWPGNVRELEHVLERMAALTQTDRFDAGDVPEFARPESPGGLISLSLERTARIDLSTVMDEVESRLVRWALERARGNLAQAAELLGVPRSTLQYKISKIAGHSSLET